MSLPDCRSPGKQSSPRLVSCSVVQLNIGGHVFTTSLSTLRKYPDSLLASMFNSGQQTKLPTDAKGRYFIDRNGTHFGAILQFLRTQRLPTENILEVYQEALHYDIKSLVKQLQDSAQVFGETVGRQQFIARVPNYQENLEVLVRVARAEAIAARHSAVIVCVIRTEEDLDRCGNAVSNLEDQEVVRFGPWKAPPTAIDLLDCIKIDVEARGYKVRYEPHSSDRGFLFKTNDDFLYKLIFTWW
ncbi:BTB/POZ domain-containing protein KCTD14 [Esox lucius]|uniref:BTB/POZ domain-containing protein KCTD14 n=1 Tax=Esox lucius TaxID=8010 RepID=C1BW61_ESOLU|nr:BTB/POZ domain-containing protein KCTD14 [Esox lucius]ACO13264.1 BTB/POZ domain-containing protein KCTD14 [Esox lucius]